jgi:tartrate-resistant acid phosphatase type 5
MRVHSRQRDVRSSEHFNNTWFRQLLTLLLFILFFAQACRLVTQSTNPPITGNVSPFPTVADPLASPQPADQSSVMLAGMPPIPANLTHYTLRVDIDYTGLAFKGYTRIDYTNTENESLDSLYLRLYPNLGQSYGNGRIIVNPALVNGQQAETKMSMYESIVEVSLPTPLNPGEKVQVDFETSGSIPVDFGGGDLNTGYGMYNYSQGILALANFYPILAVYESGDWRLDPVYGFGDSVYSDAALYTVEVLTDPGLVMATSGVWVSQQAVNGKLMRRYISGPARDFFIITSPDYLVTSRQVGRTTVNSYYLPKDAAGGEQALETAARSLEIFNSQFGPYPYKEYDIVEAPLNRPSGLEFPAMGLIAERLYTDLAAPDFNATVAHEVAHQWWYNVIGNDVLRAPWMDEALTTYSSILYWEQVGGATAKQQALAYYQERYSQNTQNGWDAPVTSPMTYFQESNQIQSYSPVVYAKGGLFFDELRGTIGDDAFFKALQFYYGTHWFTIASTSELLETFQTAKGIQLDDLYQIWLYSPELTIPTPTPIPEPTQTFTPISEPTQTATFTPTPEPTNTPALKPLVFAVIGDYGCGTNNVRDVAELMMSWQPEFIITVGDNNYPVGAADHIDEAIGQFFHHYIYPYQGIYGEGANLNRFFPTLGNHDTVTDSGQPYFDYFTLPGNERYYDFVWGPVHLFALDDLDTEPDGVSASSVQGMWLQQGLAASNSPWNIVYKHYPPYSSGYHGSTVWARWPFSEWGVDVVLSGHDHTYERLLADGVTYFVNGMGGCGLYDFYGILDYSQERDNDDYGAIRVEATDEYLLFQFFNRDNKLVDQVELRK